ncbi:magnesium/cobalt transporter CorA [Zooshikella sp. RANM57]|uniref:magnesium/cobalt transporter CorA n=1 Tax=Zooshikella sp. RANM57 TaxID=3425863 RepID=UPI003D6FA563
MLRWFEFSRARIMEMDAEQFSSDELLTKACWIDAQEPEEEERLQLEQLLRTELPESDEVEEIEASARYFVDAAGIHVHSLFLTQTEGRHKTAAVAFILQANRLITVRDDELADFRLFRMRARRTPVEEESHQSVMISLFEQKVEHLADALEDIHTDLEEVSHLVLEDNDADLEDAIDKLAKLEDSNGKIRLCLMDTQRSISFLQRHLRQYPELQQRCWEIMHDVETLMSHTSFLFDKINFLMDSTQGFINIEQNQIIKTFSIAAVVFLPPTMIASIYGMNFEFMPELKWFLGYPWALGLMVLSGIAPYWYFKRKGWL